MKYKASNTGQGKLLKNPLLEKLTKTHISVPLIFFYTTSILVLSYMIVFQELSLMYSIFLYFIGFLAFTLVEYLVHRHAFHVDVSQKSEKRQRIQYIFHGVHHDYPKDKKRLAMPIFMSILLSSTFFLIFYVTMGIYGFTFGSGFIAGYATYLFVHYAIHRFRPPNNFLKVLWVHHNIHHYAAPNAAFGVSTLFWDKIFRTMPNKK